MIPSPQGRLRPLPHPTASTPGLETEVSPLGSHFYYMIVWYRFCYEPDPRIHETGWDRARTYVGVPFSSVESDPFFQELGSDGFDSNEGCKGELVWMV